MKKMAVKPQAKWASQATASLLLATHTTHGAMRNHRPSSNALSLGLLFCTQAAQLAHRRVLYGPMQAFLFLHGSQVSRTGAHLCACQNKECVTSQLRCITHSELACCKHASDVITLSSSKKDSISITSSMTLRRTVSQAPPWCPLLWCASQNWTIQFFHNALSRVCNGSHIPRRHVHRGPSNGSLISSDPSWWSSTEALKAPVPWCVQAKSGWIDLAP